MADRTVVLFAATVELPAMAVAIELASRGVAVVRFDPTELPASLGLAAEFAAGCWGGRLSVDERSVELAEVGCAWWCPPSVTADIEAGAELGAEDARLRGLLACLPWLNPPDVLAVARYRPYQLAVATRVGLGMVPALLTNDVGAVRAFVARYKVVARIVNGQLEFRLGG